MIEETKPTAIEEDIIRRKFDDNRHSDVLDALKVLHNPESLQSTTILTNQQVNALTLMEWAGEVFEIDCFKQWVKNWCLYRISGDGGKGREDLIKVASALQIEKEKDQQRYMDLIRK